jgi:hypothetical protein
LDLKKGAVKRYKLVGLQNYGGNAAAMMGFSIA